MNGSAGGILINGGTVTINHSSLIENMTSGTNGGALLNTAGAVTVSNSSLQDNDPQNCQGPITNGGGNQDDDGSCGF